MNIDTVAGGSFVGIFFMILTTFIIILLFYLLKAYGLYHMGKRLGLENPWMAFVPFANVYFQGEVCGDLKFKKKDIAHPGIWQLGLSLSFSIILGVFHSIASAMLASSLANYWGNRGLPQLLRYSHSSHVVSEAVVGVWAILFAIATVFSLICILIVGLLRILINFQIFGKCTTPNLAVLHAFFSSLIPIYEAFVFFAFRNRVEQGITADSLENETVSVPAASTEQGN